MLTIENSTYEDWKDFFNKRLTSNEEFIMTHLSTKGNTEKEVYTQQIGNPLTTIEVSYLSRTSLIYIQILNPDTPGHNRQQEIEHFYKYSFSNDKTYGDPGLDFDIDNLKAIDRVLTNGLRGKEELFYKNGKLIKSKLSLQYGVYTQDYSFTCTYRFSDDNFLIRQLKQLFGLKDKYDIREVNLPSIFGGLK